MGELTAEGGRIERELVDTPKARSHDVDIKTQPNTQDSLRRIPPSVGLVCLSWLEVRGRFYSSATPRRSAELGVELLGRDPWSSLVQALGDNPTHHRRSYPYSTPCIAKAALRINGAAERTLFP